MMMRGMFSVLTVGLGSIASMIPATAVASDAEVTQACILAYEKAGEQRKVYQDALRARDESAKCVASCPPTLASECQAWLDEDTAKIATLEIVTALPRAQLVIRVDGVVHTESEIELNAGVHELAVAAQGQPQWAESLTVSEGQRVRRTVSTVEAEASSGLTIAGFVIGGFGVASLGAAGVLTIVGHLQASDLRETCAPDCRNKDVDDIESEWLVAGILAGVGGAALAAASVTLGFALGEEAPAATLRVGAESGRGGISVLLSF